MKTSFVRHNSTVVRVETAFTGPSNRARNSFFLAENPVMALPTLWILTLLSSVAALTMAAENLSKGKPSAL